MLKKIALSIQSVLEFILHFLRKWWRPVTCMWISGSVFVNGIYIPLKSGVPADMIALSALITAAVAAFAVREFAKVKGTAT